ncbi:transposase-like protein [Roseovarius sp. MBR-154]|jgi:transposase-like protein
MERKPAAARDAAVVEMAQGGASREEIARAFGIHPMNVTKICQAAREQGIAVPYFNAPRALRIPPTAAAALAPHARARGISTPDLAIRLLTACAEEPVLIDNILEDL